MLHAPDVDPAAMPAKYTIEVPAPVQFSFDRSRQPSYSAAFKLITTDADTFRSWTGRRYIDGVEWHGPVLQSDNTPYTGARACRCVECQRFVRPSCRPGAR